MRDENEADAATAEDRRSEQPGTGPEPDDVDEAGDESFPASDPPANTPIIRVGCPCHVS